jgi:hypothetical protein
MLSLGVGLWPQLRPTSYNWSQWFSAGQQGYVLLPGRRETLFQDEAGTTPVTAAGQTVGRILDVSGRANHFTQATSGARPAYQVDGTNRGHMLFDGVNDFMSSQVITPGSDKVCVVLGLRKLRDSLASIVLEASPNLNSNAGSFSVSAPTANGATNYSFASRGSASSGVNSSASFPSPITNVVTGLGDISGDSVILRINGTQVGSNILDQGTGNYLANQHFMGMRAGTSLPFNGRIYAAFVRYGALPSAGELAQIEAAINAETGAY